MVIWLNMHISKDKIIDAIIRFTEKKYSIKPNISKKVIVLMGRFPRFIFIYRLLAVKWEIV